MPVERVLLLALATLRFDAEEKRPVWEWAGVNPFGVDILFRRVVGIIDIFNLPPPPGIQSWKAVGPPDKFLFFDLSGNRLPTEVRADEVPKPGVVIGIRPETKDLVDLAPVIALQIGSELEKHERLKEFINEHGNFEPRPIAKYDVFFSYSTMDRELAGDISKIIEEKDLRVFVAENSIAGGQIWREEIREALSLARVMVILLTPNSVNSAWVMCEAGAAWALRKPIVPAYMFIDLNKNSRNNNSVSVSTDKYEYTTGEDGTQCAEFMRRWRKRVAYMVFEKKECNSGAEEWAA